MKGPVIMIGLLGNKPEDESRKSLLDGEDMPEGEDESCPMATQDIALNLKNRQKAIKTANYGPLDPNQPNGDFWRQKANIWRIAPSQAKNSRCGNCAAFIQTSKMMDCIEKGLGGEEDDWDTIEAGDLGFCEIFDFKCAAARTCDAWVTGGPVTDESESESEDESDMED